MPRVSKFNSSSKRKMSIRIPTPSKDHIVGGMVGLAGGFMLGRSDFSSSKVKKMIGGLQEIDFQHLRADVIAVEILNIVAGLISSVKEDGKLDQAKANELVQELATQINQANAGIGSSTLKSVKTNTTAAFFPESFRYF